MRLRLWMRVSVGARARLEEDVLAHDFARVRLGQRAVADEEELRPPESTCARACARVCACARARVCVSVRVCACVCVCVRVRVRVFSTFLFYVCLCVCVGDCVRV